MRRWVALAVTVVGMLALAAPAPAADHNMTVNEIMLSQGGNPAAQFVELLDPFDEPFVSAPYRIVVFGANGARLGAHEIGSLGTVVDNGNPMLISTPAADAALGSTGHQALSVSLPRDGGAVCFTRAMNEQKINCLAYGCVTNASLTATQGSVPADGASLQRTGFNSAGTGPPTPKAANTAAAAGPPLCTGNPPPPDTRKPLASSSLVTQTLLAVRTRGLRFRVRSDEAGRITSQLVVSLATARRLHTRTVIGSSATTLRAPGLANPTLRLAAGVAFKLRNVTTLFATLKIKVADAAGNARNLSRPLRLLRPPPRRRG